jgi:cadmium resistance protein CadD (predicted permease)
LALKKLFEIREGNDDTTHAYKAQRDTLSQVASVAAVTIANGGDNIGTYAPLFATSTSSQVAVFIFVFAVMTAP